MEQKAIMNVALYARVSKDNSHQDPETQLKDLRKYCELKGWNVVREYVDHGVSGSKASRPRLDAIMNQVGSGLFDAVLVWKFDRFARSLDHLRRTLLALNEKHVAFISFTENVDTSTAMGELVFNIVASIAQFERDLIRERVKAGLRNAVAKGHKLGCPKGSTHKDRKDLDVASIKRRNAAGETLRHIADDLGVSHSYVWKLLR